MNRFGSSSRSRDSHHSSSGNRFSSSSSSSRNMRPSSQLAPRNKTMDIQLKPALWNSANMKPFEKNFYKEHPTVTNRPIEILNNFLDKNNVIITGDRFINPILEFEEASLAPEIMNKVRELGFLQPTAIQSMCWPILLSGCDIVGIAQTGSGKTLGFIVPLVIHITNQPSKLNSSSRYDDINPIGLILAPTRELAQQTQKVAEEFGRLSGVRNICVYGGAPKGPQAGQLRRGAEIIIATPGRLLDFIKEGLINLNKCTFLVLDEADRMLDMGFEPQIRKIIQQIRPDRQTAMFSATWPKEVRKLAEDFLLNYIHITIGNADLTANPNIRQLIHVCDESEKETLLRKVLSEIMTSRDSKAIMFAETKVRVDAFSNYIRSLGYHCLTIHGDKKQSEREWVLNEFKNRPRSILVATDVAARGLNIEDIKYVVNIDYPSQTEDYIHRIGRTARSTNTGTAYTFMTQDNAKHAAKLIEVLKDVNQYVDESLLNLANSSSYGNMRGNRGSRGKGGKFSSSRDISKSSMRNPPYNGHNGSQSHTNFNSDLYGPRKRDSSEMTNGNGSSSGTTYVKKARWDNPNSSSSADYRTPTNGTAINDLHSLSSHNPLYNSNTNGSTNNTARGLSSLFPQPPPPPPPNGQFINGQNLQNLNTWKH